MSDILAVAARSNGASLEWYDKSTGRTVFFMAAGTGPQMCAVFTATLAQINAGLAFIPADANRTILPIGFGFTVTGAFATLTDIRLSDTAASPVDIMTLAQAQATNGAVITTTSTGVTLGAGFRVALTAGKGVQIRQTGTAGTGGTSISGIVEFLLV